MADVHSKAVRSYNMSQIKSKDTKPEILVRKYLFSKGYRYRLHVKDLPGKPDIILPKYKTAIFINGCFWHGHKNCKISHIPKTRTEWWENKIGNNIRRDKKKRFELRKLGWKVILIYECELKKNKIAKTFNRLLNSLKD